MLNLVLGAFRPARSVVDCGTCQARYRIFEELLAPLPNDSCIFFEQARFRLAALEGCKPRRMAASLSAAMLMLTVLARVTGACNMERPRPMSNEVDQAPIERILLAQLAFIR